MKGDCYKNKKVLKSQGIMKFRKTVEKDKERKKETAKR